PTRALYHHRLAQALQADPKGDLEEAGEHYRRALELDPCSARCRADAALLALRLGRTQEGLSLLRQAAEGAPDDVLVVGKLVKGLCLAGRADEARQALRGALFRNPKVPRLRKLWVDFRLQGLRRSADEPAGEEQEERPVLLPFVRVRRGGDSPEEA